MVVGVVVACRIILSAPVPVPVPFLWTFDMWYGIWDLDLGLDLGLTILIAAQYSHITIIFFERKHRTIFSSCALLRHIWVQLFLCNICSILSGTRMIKRQDFWPINHLHTFHYELTPMMAELRVCGPVVSNLNVLLLQNIFHFYFCIPCFTDS